MKRRLIAIGMLAVTFLMIGATAQGGGSGFFQCRGPSPDVDVEVDD